MSADEWSEPIETNLIGTIEIVREAIRSMAPRGGGSIVVLSSVVGLVGNAGQANYAASKAGLLGVVRDLARTHGSHGVRVNAVAPGYIRTRLTDEIPDDLRDRILAATALDRLGTPDDVAGPVSFLCSDASEYVTGATLSVDGGLAL
jgi:3-oxoacyl-[acyl-carrier protein] reductase